VRALPDFIPSRRRFKTSRSFMHLMHIVVSLQLAIASTYGVIAAIGAPGYGIYRGIKPHSVSPFDRGGEALPPSELRRPLRVDPSDANVARQRLVSIACKGCAASSGRDQVV
jgi:hypothetical protein